MLSRAVSFLLLVIGFTATNSQNVLTCPLSLLIPFQDDRRLDNELLMDEDPADPSQYSPSIVSSEQQFVDGVTLLATALLAMQDFNQRSSSLVPSLQNYSSCNIFYPSGPTVVDTGRTADRVRDTQGDWLTSSTCAVIGAMDNDATDAMGDALVGSIVPGLSYGARAHNLADAFFQPNVLLGTVSWEDVVMKLFQYLAAKRKDNIAILYTPGDNLDFDEYFEVFQTAKNATGLGSALLSLVWSRSNKDLQPNLKRISDERRKTIVVALRRDDNLDVLARVADGLGLLSDEHQWILLDTYLSEQHVRTQLGRSAVPAFVEKLLNRTVIFQLLDGMVPIKIEEDDNHSMSSTQTDSVAAGHAELFRTEWETRGSELIAEINDIILPTARIQGNRSIEDSFFDDHSPTYGSSFLYDSILALGMSACADVPIVKLDYLGASGHYRFVNRSLDVNSLEFGIFAIKKGGGLGGYRTVLKEATQSGEWEVVKAEETDVFLSLASSVVGLTLASVAVFFGLMCWLFIYYYRAHRIVKVAQPEFVYMACFGAILIAVPIYFLSFGEEDGWTQKQLDISCIVQEWLENCGFIIVYMALFSKLWRVEQVTQFRRRQKIEVKHAMGPFAFMLVGALAVLTVWTIVDPPSWTRDTFEGEGGGSFGYCEVSFYFAIPLDIIFVVAVVIALVMSRKTRHLAEDISDSGRVFQTLVAHFVILVVTAILLVLAVVYENYNMFYLVKVLGLFFSSVMSLAFLILSKMYFVRRYQKTGELPEGLQRGKTHISGIGSGPYSSSKYSVEGNAQRPISSSLQASGLSSGLTTSSQALQNPPKKAEPTNSPGPTSPAEPSASIGLTSPENMPPKMEAAPDEEKEEN